jgi:hypothetical protein
MACFQRIRPARNVATVVDQALMFFISSVGWPSR